MTPEENEELKFLLLVAEQKAASRAIKAERKRVADKQQRPSAPYKVVPRRVRRKREPYPDRFRRKAIIDAVKLGMKDNWEQR